MAEATLANSATSFCLQADIDRGVDALGQKLLA